MTSAPIITVASYHMRKAIGTDRRRRPDRVLHVLQEIDADVVALQEADKRIGGRGAAVPHELIDEHGMYKAVPFPCPASSNAGEPPRRQACRAAVQDQYPQSRLARQCAAGEEACRCDGRRRARPADAGTAGRGDGRTADRRPAAPWSACTSTSRACGGGGRCARSSRRSTAAAEDADHPDGRHQRMARCRGLPQGAERRPIGSRRPGPASIRGGRSPRSTASSSTTAWRSRRPAFTPAARRARPATICRSEAAKGGNRPFEPADHFQWNRSAKGLATVTWTFVPNPPPSDAAHRLAIFDHRAAGGVHAAGP